MRSKRGLCPESPVSPIIIARQKIFSGERGGLAQRTSRRKRGESGLDSESGFSRIEVLEVSCQCLVVQGSDLGLACRDEWMPRNSQLCMRSVVL